MNYLARRRARKEAKRAAREKGEIRARRAAIDFLNGQISAREFLNSEYDPRYRS